jgi:hypothetical protein
VEDTEHQQVEQVEKTVNEAPEHQQVEQVEKTVNEAPAPAKLAIVSEVAKPGSKKGVKKGGKKKGTGLAATINKAPTVNNPPIKKRSRQFASMNMAGFNSAKATSAAKILMTQKIANTIPVDVTVFSEFLQVIRMNPGVSGWCVHLLCGIDTYMSRMRS